MVGVLQLSLRHPLRHHHEQRTADTLEETAHESSHLSMGGKNPLECMGELRQRAWNEIVENWDDERGV